MIKIRWDLKDIKAPDSFDEKAKQRDVSVINFSGTSEKKSFVEVKKY